MASILAQVTLGIDVSKAQLDVYDWTTRTGYQVENSRQAICKWLKGITGPVRLGVEPTANYHLVLVDVATRSGHDVYLVNPRQLHHYRYSVGLRHKSDPHDAWLLARYVSHEAEALRRYRPLDGACRALWTMLKRRGSVVETRKRLRQSLKGVDLSVADLEANYTRLIEEIDGRIAQLIKDMQVEEEYRRCQGIPGLGPVTAAALVAAYHRGAFASSDAFVAYLGLDIRLRRSGKMKGKSKLTKHGEAEVRRLLYCASKGARSEPGFERYFQRQLNKGLSKTAARIALARKLVRVAFALMNNGESFKPGAAVA